MERIGRVDLALVAVAASYVNTLTAEQAIEHSGPANPISTCRRTMNNGRGTDRTDLRGCKT